MKKTPIIILATGVAFLVLATAGIAGAQRTGTSVAVDTLDSALLVQINDVRGTHDLVPLKRSAPLSESADEHSAEMARVGYFAHSSRDRSSFSTRIEHVYSSSGYAYWSVGENLLYAGPSIGAVDAMSLWMHSPGHRANILDPSWREIGIAVRHSDSAPGVFDGGPVTIITTDFGVRR
jgi:uncharacterized protein YkwD